VSNVSFGIIPVSARPAMMPPESFWIYDADRVRVDTVPGQVQHKAPSDVRVYEKAFEALHSVAVYGQMARDLLEIAASEFRAT
jgi:hypothetical protein